jgi:formylglycine-generating enzyme required for sulfatase activity
MIAFSCPACGRELTVKDELAGQRDICPHCEKQLLVPAPAPAAVAALPVVAPPPTPAAAIPSDLGTTVAAALPDDTPSSPEVAAAKLAFLAPPEKPDELGRLGSYRVLKVLGMGGMGLVLLADDPLLKRAVALKVMRPELAANESNRQRFLREAQATAAIDHHHIVHIHQIGEEKGVPFIVMPLLKGETLDARLKREKRLSVVDTLLLGQQIAEGLAVAHKNGLVHRDIKPANLWLEEETGWVKIVDFGLARAAAGDDMHLTQTGAILGTPAYMAPEQARSAQVDFRCDLFSLGVVLYRMLTGKLPFKGHDTMSLLASLATDTPQPVMEWNPEVPPALSDLVMKLLAKEPAQRPPSAKVVAETLGDLAGERAMPRTRTDGAVQKADSSEEAGFAPLTLQAAQRSGAIPSVLHPWALRRPSLAFAVAGVVLTLLVPIVWLSFMHRTSPPPQNQNLEKQAAIEPEKSITNPLDMKLVYIPAGTFLMGSPREEINRLLQVDGARGWPADRMKWATGLTKSEAPRHEVEITRPFYMGAHEVTVGQFRAFVNGSKYITDNAWQKPGWEQTDEHPVVNVTWKNAVDFCTWLSRKEGKTYRLPTEAEWEYCARAGKAGTRYWFGDEDAELVWYAWMRTNSANRTHLVGRLKPNAWSLHDMHGNVWEWCLDKYDADYYKNSPTRNPPGPDAGGECVSRGGSWLDLPADCRCAVRFRSYANDPSRRGRNTGFRIVLAPP